MQKTLLCILLCFTFSFSIEWNLVGNTGFEDWNVCTEYNVKCAPEAWFFIPRYARMSPAEADSNHYEIISMGNALRPFSVGNYMYTKLFCPLQAGVQYRIEMNIHTLGFEFDYIDVWTGESEPWRGKYMLSNIKPVFKITNDSISTYNLKQWRYLAHTFTAKGGERFIMIGNISQEPLLNARSKAKKNTIIEYWIDNIQLLPVDTSIGKCAEYEAIKDQVYRNDPRHPSRFIDDVEIDTALIIKPPVVMDTPVHITPKTDTLFIPDVLFKFDKSDLNPKFITRLDSFVQAIRLKPFTRLHITGHTDNYGTAAYNLKLSAERARTIKTFLVEKLMVNPGVIETTGDGETQPRATNATAAGRQLNRRVEIILYYQ